MCAMDAQTPKNTGPRWNDLYEVAAAQDGIFTTAQAATAGYSSPLLAKYLKSGRIMRVRRGIYRLVHFPPGDHEDLVVLRLWSERLGVFSHETALTLHNLSDALPSSIFMTVPSSWTSRRLRVPVGVELHYADLAHEGRTWAGPIVVTSPAQTVIDCAEARISPEIVEQAVREGLHRGLFNETMIESANRYLRSFDGGSR